MALDPTTMSNSFAQFNLSDNVVSADHDYIIK
jgi:hypothetical protein